MNKKTIIFVQNIEYPQQWAVDIFYYSKYLAEDPTYEVKVIVSKVNGKNHLDNIEVIELWNINYILFILKSFLLVKKIHKRKPISYVYFFAQHPFSVLIQILIKYILKIKTIYDVVSWPIGNWLSSIISKYTIKLGVKLSYKYVVLDKWLIEKLQLPFKKEHQIIGMWYDNELFFENYSDNIFQKNNGEIIFTYIGTLDKQRNLDIFLMAFINNLKKDKKIKLYFIWYWNSEEKLRYIAWDYIWKHIFFLGKKSHSLIPKYINSSDVMISYIPKVEYFEYQPPTKLIEYLACNKLVIATNTIAQEKIMDIYWNLIHKDDICSTQKQIEYIIDNFSDLNDSNYIDLVKNYKWVTLIEKQKTLMKY